MHVNCDIVKLFFSFINLYKISYVKGFILDYRNFSCLNEIFHLNVFVNKSYKTSTSEEFFGYRSLFSDELRLVSTPILKPCFVTAVGVSLNSSENVEESNFQGDNKR